jgi:single-strand DNA-binding protein
MTEFRLPVLNRVFIAGNLTRDPELRYTASGVPVANFRIASNRWFRTQDGERREDVCYINVVVWQRLAELVGERLHKGSAVLVEGELQSRSWDTDDGTRRTVVEIRAYRVQFLNRQETTRLESRAGDSEENQESSTEDFVDDLPF